MDDLYRALGDISSIRKHLANTTEFRGYGPATLAITGVLAMLAAAIQALVLTDPQSTMPVYLALWIATAVLSASLVLAQMCTRARRIHSALSDEMIRMAMEQFLPSVAAGVLLSLVILHYIPLNSWMLPGLWQILFSLGVFSSCRFLPRPMVAAGVWYLMTGLKCLALGSAAALSPWAMGISFGAGQLLVAGILAWSTRESGYEL